MRYILLAALVSLSTMQTKVLADHTPKSINVSIEQAFIPVGFDDNDKAQFAIIGSFADTCHRVGPYSLKVDEQAKTIKVTQQAYAYEGVCIPLQVPYSQIVTVGLVRAGDYKIIDDVSQKELGMVNITASKNTGPDDFLYAPINDAYIVSETDAKKNTLVLTGSFSDRCSVFEDIRVIYQKNVLVVQPIIKRVVPFRCIAEKTRFLKTIDLKEGVHGVHLLHVRSLEGQAINKMVELE